ncbi:MAG: hypothetical protein ACXWQR_18455 [Ktedonobacterales bacterium]
MPATSLRRKTSATSDPVFGQSWHELVSQGVTLYIRVEDYNRYRASNTRKPLPTSLNRNVIDDGNPELKSDGRARRLGTYGGGLVFSPAFNEYIAQQVPHMIAETRLSCWRWFESEYVYAAMLRAFPSDEDRRAIAGVLAYRRDGRDLAVAATQQGHTTSWLCRKEKQFVRYARDQFGMPGSVGPDVQVWHAPIETGPLVTGEMAG